MNTTTTTTTTTTDARDNLDAALAAINAEHAALVERVAALKAKADRLDAMAETTWNLYRAAILDSKDFEAARALRRQYGVELIAANRARGQVRAAYTRHSAKRRAAYRAAFLA